MPYGRALAVSRNPESVRVVAETQRAVVGGIALGPMIGTFGIPIRVPVVRDGRTCMC